jgi:transposase-like protein
VPTAPKSWSRSRRDVFPATREQRCWFHKIANVLNALPKSAQPGAKATLAEIWNAENREHALRTTNPLESGGDQQVA